MKSAPNLIRPPLLEVAADNFFAWDHVESAIRGSGTSAALALTKQPHFYVSRKVASEVAENIFSWQNNFLKAKSLPKLANRH